MKTLSKEAESLKNGILADYTFDDQASLAILQTACEAYDAMHKAQRIVDKDGMTVQGDRGGTKAHPLLSVIRDSRAQFLMAIKALKLDTSVSEGKPVGRPTEYERAAAGKIYGGRR